jgi:CDP-diacylglycerol--glycerol-3-phosphate 3-phosphatidyltransferase
VPDASGARTAYQARGRMISSGAGPASTWNAANLITIGRILLAPVFVWLLFADAHAGGPLRWLATALFVLAIATDSVDGRLASRPWGSSWSRSPTRC